MARSYYQALSCAATRKCALKATLRFALSDGWRHVGRILRAEYGEDFHNSGPIGMARQTGDWKFQKEPVIFRSMQSICPRCRSPMICQPDGGCWCAKLPIVTPMPADDAAHCVCPNCLREMQDKARPATAAADHDRTEETHGSQTH